MRRAAFFGSIVRRTFLIRAAAFAVPLVMIGIAAAAPLALYVTDNGVISAYDATSGAPLQGFAPITGPGATGLAIGPDQNLYAASTTPAQVYRFDPATGAQIGGPFVSFNGQGDGHDVQSPQGMRFGPGGNLYIADAALSDVHVYGPAGNSLGTIEGQSLLTPGDVALDTTGNLPANNVFVVNPGTANILVSTGLGHDFVDFTAAGAGGLIIPVSLSFGPDHDLYVLDTGGGAPKVVRFLPNGTPAGTVVSFTGDNPFSPAYLAFGPDGNIYVSGQDATGLGEILKFATDGTPLGTFIGGLGSPTFMAFSAAVPEPSTLVLAALGILGLVNVRLRSAQTRRQILSRHRIA
jgi:hypothetical protein